MRGGVGFGARWGEGGGVGRVQVSRWLRALLNLFVFSQSVGVGQAPFVVWEYCDQDKMCVVSFMVAKSSLW